jgi:pheromone alpha factor receptor
MSDLPDSNVVDFDPSMQDISFRGPDGQSIVVSIKDINKYYLYSARSAISFGTQMGACIVMAVVLVAFTSRPSMRKPLFALNLASLVLGFLRSLFLALYTVSPWTEFYASFSGDMSGVTAIHYSNSIAGTIFPLLMVISVNTSLVLQAHAVCVQLNQKALRIPLFLISIAVVLLAIGFRVAICITNIHSILHADFYGPNYLRSATLITSTVAIWWFTGIFLAKLCYTIWMRKKMGWKSINAFHTLVIAGGCTMIIPCKCCRARVKHIRVSEPLTDQQQLSLRSFNM